MNRRDFLATGAGGAVGATLHGANGVPAAVPARGAAAALQDARPLFARLADEVFINAAGGTPLSSFAERGLREYEDFWRLGPADGRGAAFGTMLDGTRAGLARLIGATPAEIAFVQCTKHGEQIVLDGLSALRAGGNVVTNDLHFAGSLHNLIGLRRAGMEVRIARAVDWRTDLDAMAALIDDDTALVSVTLVSNVNGHIEPMREIAELAHARGAYVYADIIQAAGIVPIDVEAMGIDFAAGNGYKWLFGPHGTGFLYVRRELQGDGLEDRLFPGHVQLNYRPWAEPPDETLPDFIYAPRDDAQRYQPGHQAYLCYSALHQGLAFIEGRGVATLQAHSVALNRRLLDGLDAGRYECISPHTGRAPIIAFRGPPGPGVLAALQASKVVVALSGESQIRVSPGVYNNEADIDALIAVLNGV